jgi:cbb3-type cytochrome oxidase subunit 1
MKDLVGEYRSRNWRPDIILAVTRSVQTSVILLFVQGISGHNLFRYNWYMFATFVSIMTFVVAHRVQHEQGSAEINGSGTDPAAAPSDSSVGRE